VRSIDGKLPCLQAVLAALRETPGILVIDGYVWLGNGNKGLGAHLYESRGRVGAVVGIAKTAFAGAEPVREVIRGQSQRPLFVSAVGIDLDEACACVKTMHGEFRVPWALAEVDRLARQWDGRSGSVAGDPADARR
jgi:deoxyribonuclease V